MYNNELYLSKFGFQFVGTAAMTYYQYNILVDLSLKEIKFELTKDYLTEVIGYHITQEELSTLLPLLIIKDYEKYYDKDYRDTKYIDGYRNGWGIMFWCISDTIMPMLQIYMSELYRTKNLPPYEKVLNWVKQTYECKKEIKRKKLLW